MEKPRDPLSPVHARLRESTRAAHTGLEGDMQLLDPAQSRARYLRTMDRFYSFYRAFEARLTGIDDRLAARLDLAARRKLPLLARDLQALGQPLPATEAALPAWDFTRPAQALGALYVMEGSTLGGRMLAAHFQKALGLEADTGLAFYTAYGPRTGERWKDFLAVLADSVTGEAAIEECVRTANEAFAAIGAHFKD